MRRSLRFCQYLIEWNYFSANLADHAADDRTLSFRPRSTLIWIFCHLQGIRVALLHSRVTRFIQRPHRIVYRVERIGYWRLRFCVAGQQFIRNTANRTYRSHVLAMVTRFETVRTLGLRKD
jgi:membrane-bound acyltransferase YfiQ involved in biofilm formation